MGTIYSTPAPVQKPALKTRQLSNRPRRPSDVPHIQTIAAKAKLDRDYARFYAWCAATEGKLPSQPGWCADFPPLTVLTRESGANGKVSLTAHDASGAGVDGIEYSLDGQHWTTYTGPFALPTGANNLQYRAKDKKGKVEEAKRKAL